MNTTYLFISLSAVIAIFLVLLFMFSSKKETKEEVKPQNKRRAFRLSFMDKQCMLRPVSSHESFFEGSIRDISATGMKLVTYEDMMTQSEIKVIFELNEMFSLTGKIMRRKNLKNGNFEYGVHFTHLDEETEQRLYKILWDMSREKVVM